MAGGVGGGDGEDEVVGGDGGGGRRGEDRRCWRAWRWWGLAEMTRSARAPDSIWRRRTWEPAKLGTTRTLGLGVLEGVGGLDEGFAEGGGGEDVEVVGGGGGAGGEEEECEGWGCARKSFFQKTLEARRGAFGRRIGGAGGGRLGWQAAGVMGVEGRR